MLDLVKKFESIESRPVPDPLGGGTTWHIRHAGHKEFRAWADKQENPYVRAVVELGVKAAGIANAKMAGRRADPKARKAAQGDAFTALLEKADLNVDPAEMRRALDPEGLVLLVETIDGLTSEGEPVEFSREVALELLNVGEIIAEDYVFQVNEDGDSYRADPDAEEQDEELYVPKGSTVGELLSAWLYWEAGRAEMYRARTLEGMAGN